MFAVASSFAYTGNQLVTDFNVWKVSHAKKYDTSSTEASALAAFASNDAIIKEHNHKDLSYKLGHNEFSDMTWDEFHATVMNGGLHLNRAPKNMMRTFIQSDAPMADAVDWVAAGAVTPVKNQDRCGSCWAFSTTGSVEGALFIASKKLVSLSEEDLVQCDHVDSGCQGGLMDNGFDYISKNGICSEADYPYTSGSGTTGTCKSPTCSPVATLTGHMDVPKGDEKALKAAISNAPVSVSIEADKSAFQLYKSGVLDSPDCGEQLDHGVLAVGYGTDTRSIWHPFATGKDYYKVKNSWGTTWGESGYLRMVQGKNMCGIASQASYPTGVTASSGPKAAPSSFSPPTSAVKTHYGDPKAGCLSDEQENRDIMGTTGDFCSPACVDISRSGVWTCSSDIPTGVTAKPECALIDPPPGGMYCALVCSPTADIVDQKVADAQCGANATCKPVTAIRAGLCTYDD